MPRLFASPNQSRILAIRGASGGDDAEALARLFEDGGIADDGTLPGRLDAVLRATAKGLIKGLQTGLPFSDEGFAGDREPGGEGYRDPWPSSRNQVGHFLTAVGLGFRPATVSAPVLGVPLRAWLGAGRELSDESVAVRLTVGHELAADPGLLAGASAVGAVGGLSLGLLGLPGVAAFALPGAGLAAGAFAGALFQQFLGFRRQFHEATVEDERAFLSAAGCVRDDPVAAEAALATVARKVDVRARGNSTQDLRLSLAGWSLGAGVRDGSWADGPAVAAWLRGRLKAK